MNEQPAQSPAHGYICFIGEIHDDSYVNIGWAHDIDARLAKLREGNHRQLACYASIKSSDPVADEAYIREMHGDALLRGNWYIMSGAGIAATLAHMETRPSFIPDDENEDPAADR